MSELTTGAALALACQREYAKQGYSFWLACEQLKMRANQIWGEVGKENRMAEAWITNIFTGEDKMNNFIVETYPNTKDAMLIWKHFSRDVETPFRQFLIKGREQELLALAKELEAKEQAEKD